MAFLGQTFDASAVEPSAPRELLPPGEYLVQIVQSEMKATRAGTGQMLALEMDIIDGPHSGRKLWDNLNLVNPNPQAVEIAQRTLSAICHAVGQMQVIDSEQLHFKPMLAVVEVIPAGTDKKGYTREKPENKVKGYKAASGQAPARAAGPQQRPAPQQQAPAAAKPAGSAPPWRRTAA